jgi:decaprenyl-diphosphate synthase subunit 1
MTSKSPLCSSAQELRRNTTEPELRTIATYYFDGQGKALRPMIAILMARAINYHMYKEKR